MGFEGHRAGSSATSEPDSAYAYIVDTQFQRNADTNGVQGPGKLGEVNSRNTLTVLSETVRRMFCRAARP